MVLPTQVAVRPILLKTLAELGGAARPAAVYPLVTAKFPELTEQDLTTTLRDGRTNQWTNRIQWARQDLVLAGLIDATQRGIWALTPEGRALGTGEPTAAQLRPPTRRRTRGPENEAAPAPQVSAVERDIVRLSTHAERIGSELTESATDSKQPSRLERAAGAAFAFLGFEVEVIGGAGETDILLEAPLGINRYRVIIDAKSTASGRVPDAMVDWLSMRRHREQHDAQYACLVGPGFGGGQLIERAKEFGVTLLTANDLMALVRMHETTPLTLVELRPLFEMQGVVRADLGSIRAASSERARRHRLVLQLLRYVDNFNRLQPDMVLRQAGDIAGVCSVRSRLAGDHPGGRAEGAPIARDARRDRPVEWRRLHIADDPPGGPRPN